MQSNTQRIVLAGAVTAALIAVPLAIAQDSMPPKSGAVAPVPDAAAPPPSQSATPNLPQDLSQDLPPHLPPPAAAPGQPPMIPSDRAAPPPVADAPPPPPHQRFTFTPVLDGILRLDSESGQVTICSTRTVGWACQAVPEDRAALETEIDRLQADNRTLKRDLETLKADNETLKADNRTLKDQIAALTAPPPPPVPPQTVPPQTVPPQDQGKSKSDTPQLNQTPPATGKPGSSSGTSGELKLPNKEDLERARVMLQDAWRRLVEMLGQWQDQMRRS